MWISYFGQWAAGPPNFPCCLGWSHNPLNRHRVLHFLPNLTSFSQFTPIFTDIFSNFSTMCHNFFSFMLLATLLTPSSFSFYSFGYLWDPSDWTVFEFRDGDFETQLPARIGSLEEVFLFAPYFSHVKDVN